jgi:hypothetical protein
MVDVVICKLVGTLTAPATRWDARAVGNLSVS